MGRPGAARQPGLDPPGHLGGARREGAEIDPGSLRRHLGKALAIGSASFALPAAAAFLFAYFVAGWDLHAAEIAGIALSTTSVAVVYAVMIESLLRLYPDAAEAAGTFQRSPSAKGAPHYRDSDGVGSPCS